uniref:Conserved virulence factor C n=1 Tax=Ganoderma boninense TaxID=34458 RepID=A0A5K1JZM1_9APHY|nr:Conserved virulence factor C [Ganoderma boninense]
MHFSALVVTALSAALVGSVEAVFTGQATAFTGLAPIKSATCDGIYYTQENYVVKLSSQNTTPCNATIAVVNPEFGTGIYGVLVVDSCTDCGENDVVLSALAFADYGGLLSLQDSSFSVEWYVETEP